MTGESDSGQLNLVKCPVQYGGNSQFRIDVEAGPWLGYEPTYEEDEETKMIESDDDQLDLLGGD